jgi:hypothetical protein
LQVYKVDLMKLYLREKNLSNVTRVNLAGISPAIERSIELGDGKDYKDKERMAELGLKDEGAYLVICRGDNLFTSGLVLVTPLKLEIQEDVGAGSIRVNVLNQLTEGYEPKVHVKVIGSADQDFKSGETDLRGVFATEGVNGRPTVIARTESSHYAFYRGARALGKTTQPNPVQRQPSSPIQQLQKGDYLMNTEKLNKSMNDRQISTWDMLRRSGKGGVQIKSAF